MSPYFEKVSEKNEKKISEKGDWQSQRIIVPGVRDAGRPYRVGGELMHKGPTVGKVKPGMTFYCAELRGVLRDHNSYKRKCSRVRGVRQPEVARYAPKVWWPWVDHWRAVCYVSLWKLTNRMSELFTSGSVGGAAGDRCLYPAADLANRRAFRVFSPAF